MMWRCSQSHPSDAHTQPPDHDIVTSCITFPTIGPMCALTIPSVPTGVRGGSLWGQAIRPVPTVRRVLARTKLSTHTSSLFTRGVSPHSHDTQESPLPFSHASIGDDMRNSAPRSNVLQVFTHIPRRVTSAVRSPASPSFPAMPPRKRKRVAIDKAQAAAAANVRPPVTVCGRVLPLGELVCSAIVALLPPCGLLWLRFERSDSISCL